MPILTIFKKNQLILLHDEVKYFPQKNVLYYQNVS